MPATWFPEGNTALPSDSKRRSLQKVNAALHDTHGDVANVGYPEGVAPLPSDSEKRSKTKINAIYDAT